MSTKKWLIYAESPRMTYLRTVIAKTKEEAKKLVKEELDRYEVKLKSIQEEK